MAAEVGTVMHPQPVGGNLGGVQGAAASHADDGLGLEGLARRLGCLVVGRAAETGEEKNLPAEAVLLQHAGNRLGDLGPHLPVGHQEHAGTKQGGVLSKMGEDAASLVISSRA